MRRALKHNLIAGPKVEPVAVEAGAVGIEAANAEGAARARLTGAALARTEIERDARVLDEGVRRDLHHAPIALTSDQERDLEVHVGHLTARGRRRRPRNVDGAGVAKRVTEANADFPAGVGRAAPSINPGARDVVEVDVRARYCIGLGQSGDC